LLLCFEVIFKEQFLIILLYIFSLLCSFSPIVSEALLGVMQGKRYKGCAPLFSRDLHC